MIGLRDRMKALTLLILLTLPVAAVAQTGTRTKVSMLDGTIQQGTLVLVSSEEVELLVDASKRQAADVGHHAD
jgi:hypothetical protein